MAVGDEVLSPNTIVERIRAGELSFLDGREEYIKTQLALRRATTRPQALQLAEDFFKSHFGDFQEAEFRNQLRGEFGLAPETPATDPEYTFRGERVDASPGVLATEYRAGNLDISQYYLLLSNYFMEQGYSRSEADSRATEWMYSVGGGVTSAGPIPTPPGEEGIPTFPGGPGGRGGEWGTSYGQDPNIGGGGQGLGGGTGSGAVPYGGGPMPVIPSSDVPVSSYLGYDPSSGRPDPFTRFTALEKQREDVPADVFSRVTQSIPGFSGFNPYVKKAIQDRYGDARARFNLSQFTSPDTGFEDFLGGGGAWGRGDPGVLKGQLGNLRDYLESGVTSFAGQPALSASTLRGLQGTFADPERLAWSRGNLLQALLQPGLATVAPSLRGAFASATGQEFDRFLASNPEAGVLGEFSRRGFF